MTAFPIFLSRPLRVVGIPVALAKSRFTLEIPRARFQEKLRPGIFIVQESKLWYTVCYINTYTKSDSIVNTKSEVKLLRASDFSGLCCGELQISLV